MPESNPTAPSVEQPSAEQQAVEQPPAEQPPAERLAVAQLSLEQKAALLSGRDFWSTRAFDAAGVPSIVLTDGPHGCAARSQFDRLGLHQAVPAMRFPPAVAVGSSWDPRVAGRIGATVGREARALGVHVVLGPGVNIKRSPLCGRNFEYYSEDPLLLACSAPRTSRASKARASGRRSSTSRRTTRKPTDAGQRRCRRAHAARDLPARLRADRHPGPAGDGHVRLQQGQRRVRGSRTGGC